MSKEKDIGRIGVLMGGCSSEREISLKSGQAVHAALMSAGCDSVAIDLTTTVEEDVLGLVKDSGLDLVFIALHGTYGEDGTLQELLDQNGIVYTGCGPQASRMAMNKAVTQELWRRSGLSIPEYCVVEKKPDGSFAPPDISHYSVAVKPVSEGSSMGVSIVRSRDDLDAALKAAFAYGDQVMVDRFIPGRELTVGILGQKALPVVEIRPQSEFFDFEAKYKQGKTAYLVPAPLEEETARILQECALKAFRALNGRDLARVDFILEEETQCPYLLEMNTIPGFTQTSLLPMAAVQEGYSFEQLCVLIAELASARRGRPLVSG